MNAFFVLNVAFFLLSLDVSFKQAAQVLTCYNICNNKYFNKEWMSLSPV